MIMTEAEAKEKWCPFVRQMHAQFELSFNRMHPGGIAENCNCIASDCMAWRWYVDPLVRELVDNPPKRVGFCGLAGNPDG